MYLLAITLILLASFRTYQVYWPERIVVGKECVQRSAVPNLTETEEHEQEWADFYAERKGCLGVCTCGQCVGGQQVVYAPSNICTCYDCREIKRRDELSKQWDGPGQYQQMFNEYQQAVNGYERIMHSSDYSRYQRAAQAYEREIEKINATSQPNIIWPEL